MALSEWMKAQRHEEEWWGACANTYAEETQQIWKANLMDLPVESLENPYRYPVIDLTMMEGDQLTEVLDIGGGPCSLLLKCIGVVGTVLEPARYPDWVWMRYKECGIEVLHQKAEDMGMGRRYDEAWIYNTLRHVEDPERVIWNARRASEWVRVCEWVEEDTPHGHTLYALDLDGWFGSKKVGRVEEFQQENGEVWYAYYGVFPGGDDPN